MVAWARGGLAKRDVWPAVPVLKSIGGSAGLFAMPPHVDAGKASPQAQVLSTDPQGGEFASQGERGAARDHDRRVGEHVRLVPFLQTAGPNLATATRAFTAGHFPLSNLLVKMLN